MNEQEIDEKASEITRDATKLAIEYAKKIHAEKFGLESKEVNSTISAFLNGYYSALQLSIKKVDQADKS